MDQKEIYREFCFGGFYERKTIIMPSITILYGQNLNLAEKTQLQYAFRNIQHQEAHPKQDVQAQGIFTNFIKSKINDDTNSIFCNILINKKWALMSTFTDINKRKIIWDKQIHKVDPSIN